MVQASGAPDRIAGIYESGSPDSTFDLGCRLGQEVRPGDLVLLSGGLDSSSIASAAANVLGHNTPNRLRAYTFVYDEPDPDDRDTLVSIALVHLGGSTRLTLDHEGFATEARRALHEQGWTETLDRLGGLISGGAALE